jgi:hypothetical protein
MRSANCHGLEKVQTQKTAAPPVNRGLSAEVRLVPPERDRPIADRIADLETALAALKREQVETDDQAFLLTLQRVIPPGVVFRCTDVLDHATLHPDLAAAIGPMDAQQLGIYFAQLARRRPDAFERIGRSENGCYWQLRVTC